MKATIVFEMASDGGYACYMQESIPDMALFGYGNSVEEAKKVLLESYSEISEMLRQEGKDVPELDFYYQYDLKSFFNYFDFINVSKVAERASINPSLMRKYSAGIVKPREKQYNKVLKVIQQFTSELQKISI